MCRPWLASLALILILAPGCGPEIMAYTPTPPGVLLRYGPDWKLAQIDPGEHVQNLGEATDPLNKLPNPRRVLRIKVLTGKLAGQVGYVSLGEIQPVPR